MGFMKSLAIVLISFLIESIARPYHHINTGGGGGGGQFGGHVGGFDYGYGFPAQFGSHFGYGGYGGNFGGGYSSGFGTGFIGDKQFGGGFGEGGFGRGTVGSVFSQGKVIGFPGFGVPQTVTGGGSEGFVIGGDQKVNTGTEVNIGGSSGVEGASGVITGDGRQGFVVGGGQKVDTGANIGGFLDYGVPQAVAGGGSSGFVTGGKQNVNMDTEANIGGSAGVEGASGVITGGGGQSFVVSGDQEFDTGANIRGFLEYGLPQAVAGSGNRGVVIGGSQKVNTNTEVNIEGSAGVEGASGVITGGGRQGFVVGGGQEFDTGANIGGFPGFEVPQTVTGAGSEGIVFSAGQKANTDIEVNTGGSASVEGASEVTTGGGTQGFVVGGGQEVDTGANIEGSTGVEVSSEVNTGGGRQSFVISGGQEVDTGTNIGGSAGAVGTSEIITGGGRQDFAVDEGQKVDTGANIGGSAGVEGASGVITGGGRLDFVVGGGQEVDTGANIGGSAGADGTSQVITGGGGQDLGSAGVEGASGAITGGGRLDFVVGGDQEVDTGANIEGSVDVEGASGVIPGDGRQGSSVSGGQEVDTGANIGGSAGIEAVSETATGERTGGTIVVGGGQAVATVGIGGTESFEDASPTVSTGENGNGSEIVGNQNDSIAKVVGGEEDLQLPGRFIQAGIGGAGGGLTVTGGEPLGLGNAIGENLGVEGSQLPGRFVQAGIGGVGGKLAVIGGGPLGLGKAVGENLDVEGLPGRFVQAGIGRVGSEFAVTGGGQLGFGKAIGVPFSVTENESKGVSEDRSGVGEGQGTIIDEDIGIDGGVNFEEVPGNVTEDEKVSEAELTTIGVAESVTSTNVIGAIRGTEEINTSITEDGNRKELVGGFEIQKIPDTTGEGAQVEVKSDNPGILVQTGIGIKETFRGGLITDSADDVGTTRSTVNEGSNVQQDSGNTAGTETGIGGNQGLNLLAVSLDGIRGTEEINTSITEDGNKKGLVGGFETQKIQPDTTGEGVQAEVKSGSTGILVQTGIGITETFKGGLITESAGDGVGTTRSTVNKDSNVQEDSGITAGAETNIGGIQGINLPAVSLEGTISSPTIEGQAKSTLEIKDQNNADINKHEDVITKILEINSGGAGGSWGKFVVGNEEVNKTKIGTEANGQNNGDSRTLSKVDSVTEKGRHDNIAQNIGPVNEGTGKFEVKLEASNEQGYQAVAGAEVNTANIKQESDIEDGNRGIIEIKKETHRVATTGHQDGSAKVSGCSSGVGGFEIKVEGGAGKGIKPELDESVKVYGVNSSASSEVESDIEGETERILKNNEEANSQLFIGYQGSETGDVESSTVDDGRVDAIFTTGTPQRNEAVAPESGASIGSDIEEKTTQSDVAIEDGVSDLNNSGDGLDLGVGFIEAPKASDKEVTINNGGINAEVQFGTDFTGGIPDGTEIVPGNHGTPIDQGTETNIVDGTESVTDAIADAGVESINGFEDRTESVKDESTKVVIIDKEDKDGDSKFKTSIEEGIEETKNFVPNNGIIYDAKVEVGIERGTESNNKDKIDNVNIDAVVEAGIDRNISTDGEDATGNVVALIREENEIKSIPQIQLEDGIGSENGRLPVNSGVNEKVEVGSGIIGEIENTEKVPAEIFAGGQISSEKEIAVGNKAVSLDSALEVLSKDKTENKDLKTDEELGIGDYEDEPCLCG